MKHTIWVLSACFLSSVAGAQSTCETRVDAHQQASTMQRVHYCLTPQSEPVSNPGLVFSGVSSPRSSVSYVPSEDEPLARDGSFKPQKVGIAKVFVETRRFPKWREGRVSQQEMLAKQGALQEGKKIAQETVAQNECVLPDELAQEPVAETVVSQKVTNSQTRSAKPARKNAKKKKTKSVAKIEQHTQQTAGQGTDGLVDSASYGKNLPSGTEIAVGTVSYAPAGQEEIPVGTSSYAPATNEMADYDEYYMDVGQEEIPVGTASYAPAN